MGSKSSLTPKPFTRLTLKDLATRQAPITITRQYRPRTLPILERGRAAWAPVAPLNRMTDTSEDITLRTWSVNIYMYVSEY